MCRLLSKRKVMCREESPSESAPGILLSAAALAAYNTASIHQAH
jgi:hypothetical protein